MKLVELKEERLEELRELFCECFFDDWYYAQMFPDQETRRQKMGAAFEGTLRFCLKNGFCFGVEDASRLIAFILCFDFHRCRERCPEEFAAVFSGTARTGGERETDLCARQARYTRTIPEPSTSGAFRSTTRRHRNPSTC